MDDLLEATAIVEQSDGEEEEAEAVDATHDSVEFVYPAIIYFWITFARKWERQYCDKVCTVGKDIEDKKEGFE